MADRSSIYGWMEYDHLDRLDERGRNLVTLNYVLYILGFFTGITAFVAVVLAYLRRPGATGILRSHLDWQIRIFWVGLASAVAFALLHAVIAGLGVITLGLGLVFMVIPWAMAFAWAVWTIWAIARGMHRLSRYRPMP